MFYLNNSCSICHLFILVEITQQDWSDTTNCHIRSLMRRGIYSAHTYIRDLILRAFLTELKFQENRNILIITKKWSHIVNNASMSQGYENMALPPLCSKISISSFNCLTLNQSLCEICYKCSNLTYYAHDFTCKQLHNQLLIIDYIIWK